MPLVYRIRKTARNEELDIFALHTHTHTYTCVCILGKNITWKLDGLLITPPAHTHTHIRQIIAPMPPRIVLHEETLSEAKKRN